jgi:hypothetical protein
VKLNPSAQHLVDDRDLLEAHIEEPLGMGHVEIDAVCARHSARVVGDARRVVGDGGEGLAHRARARAVSEAQEEKPARSGFACVETGERQRDTRDD